MLNFVAEVFRRRVPQIIAVYLIGAWGLIEILDWAGTHLGMTGPWADVAMAVALALLPSVALVSYGRGGKRSTLQKRVEPIVIAVSLSLAVGLAAVVAFRNRPSPLGGAGHPTAEVRIRLTESGRTSWPEYSPDGRFVAHLARDSNSVAVRVIDLTEGTSQEVFRYQKVYRVWWIPGGDSLDVAAGAGTAAPVHYRVAREGGQARIVEMAAQFNWVYSPDGSQLAYGRSDPVSLIVQPAMDSVVTEPLRLSFPWESDGLRGFSWSPTAAAMAVATGRENRTQIWTLPLDGSEPHELGDVDGYACCPRWSPDGRALFYYRPRELWRIDVDPVTGRLSGPRDGEYTGVRLVQPFSLSPNGRDLVTTDYSSSSTLWRYQADGDVPGGYTASQFTVGFISGLSIEPDGRSLVYSESGSLQLMEFEPNGSKRVLPTTSPVYSSAWSPDGSQLAFEAPDDSDSLRVWTMTVPSGAPRVYKSTYMEPFGDLTWCEAGILFHRPGKRNFGVLDPESGKTRDLLDKEAGRLFSPRCNPYGEELVFYWNREPAGLWILSMQTGEARLLEEGFKQPLGWSDDGRWIYALDRLPGRVVWFRIRFPEGGSEVIAEIALGEMTAAHAVGTADGSTLVLVLRDERTDIWRVENFEGQQAGRP